MNSAIIRSSLFLILYLFWTIEKESAGTPRMMRAHITSDQAFEVR